jgi:hypothetical protein
VSAALPTRGDFITIIGGDEAVDDDNEAFLRERLGFSIKLRIIVT